MDATACHSAAIFLDSTRAEHGLSAKDIWMVFIFARCKKYPGYPNRLRINQYFVIRTEEWKLFTDLAGTQWRLSGIWAPSSPEIGVRYYFLPWQIFRLILLFCLPLSKKFACSVTAKAMNNILDENGLVPTTFVFGIISLFLILSTELTIPKKSMEKLKSAQSKIR